MQEQFVAGGKQLESISIECLMQVQRMGIDKILTILLLMLCIDTLPLLVLVVVFEREKKETLTELTFLCFLKCTVYTSDQHIFLDNGLDDALTISH